MVGAGWIDDSGDPLLPEFRAPEQGAATHVWAATSPDSTALGTTYCKACAVVETRRRRRSPRRGGSGCGLSAELTGLDAFAAGVGTGASL